MSEFKTIFRQVGEFLVKHRVPVWHALGPNDVSCGPDGLPDFGLASEQVHAPSPPADQTAVADAARKGAQAPTMTPFEMEMRRAQICGSLPARSRPELSTQLASDPSIPVAEAVHHLAHAPVEILPDYRHSEAVPGNASFGLSIEAPPLSHADKVKQFVAVAQAAVDEREVLTVRI